MHLSCAIDLLLQLRLNMKATMASDRILIVTPVFTNPPIQGNAARVLAFGRELKSRGFEVDVAYYGLDHFGPDYERLMQREWRRFFYIPSKPHRSPAYPECWGIDDWCHDSLLASLKRILDGDSYDAVVVNYAWMSRCFEAVDGPKKILDTHDMFGDRHKVSIDAGLDPNWYFTRCSDEDIAFDRADLVIGIQHEETQIIANRTSRPTTTVGHPVEPAFLMMQDSSYKVATFGYFASRNPWNIRSVVDLDGNLAQRGFGDWAVAGSISDATEIQYLSSPYLFGRVNELQDFYSHVDCCVNPMVGGTGLKIKTVEAMAYGRSVLGTQDAFAGLDAIHPFHSLSDAAAVADAMIEYHASKALQRDVLEATRSLFFDYMAGISTQYDQLASFIRN